MIQKTKITYNKGGVGTNLKTFEIESNKVFDRMIKPGEQNVLLEFEFNGDPTDIIQLRPGCGCTSSLGIVGNKIQAHFTDTVVTKSGYNISEQDKARGYLPISRTFYVYLDDGVDMYAQKGMNKSINNNKINIPVNFTVKVDLSEFKR